ncbi:hypothetical protein K0M31_008336 [Melipona bicolor]|uniref:Uncharacterized protein n=1 Tax=Melipona bicolor TaxID=60889 RepID=A0AA40KKF5_9HYME|nr:hypothetical protein K0M31_008336 [Melipona bicolor]
MGRVRGSSLGGHPKWRFVEGSQVETGSVREEPRPNLDSKARGEAHLTRINLETELGTVCPPVQVQVQGSDTGARYAG